MNLSVSTTMSWVVRVNSLKALWKATDSGCDEERRICCSIVAAKETVGLVRLYLWASLPVSSRETMNCVTELTYGEGLPSASA